MEPTEEWHCCWGQQQIWWVARPKCHVLICTHTDAIMHIHHTVQQTQRVKEEHVETAVAPEDSSRQLSKGFFFFSFFLNLFLRQTLCHGALKSFSTGTPSLLSELYRSKPQIRPHERWNGKCPKLYVKVNAKLYLLLPAPQPPLHQHIGQVFLTFTLNIN